MPCLIQKSCCKGFAKYRFQHYFLFQQDYPLNPKALSLGELYGEFDLNTNEWTDGVLSSVMRQTCAGKNLY